MHKSTGFLVFNILCFILDESYSEMKYGQCCFYGCHKEAHCRLDVDQYSIRTGEESTILTITLHALDGQRVCNTTLLVTIIDCQGVCVCVLCVCIILYNICNSYCMTNCALGSLLLESQGCEAPEGECNKEPVHSWS